MKAFMDEDFLLENEIAKTLYHQYAAHMPIFDYHNHLSVKEIYENKDLGNITYAWLGFDHYKWRAMRSNGIEEAYITGNASDKEKFDQWAKTVPYLFGNPLYHWTHLELQRIFDIHEPLNGKNADAIYDRCNTLLKQDDFHVRELLKKQNVKILCTTDDPCDDLHYHKALKEEGFAIKVLPAFRPDNAVHIEKETFMPYVKRLETVIQHPLHTYAQFKEALLQRVHYFHEAGCRFADHGLDRILYQDSNEAKLQKVYEKAIQGEKLSLDEVREFQGDIQTALGKEYHKLGWVMQLHIGPMRNNSSRMYASIGKDAGFDSMDDQDVARELSALLNAMDQSGELPKTILYCLNPKDNATLASMLGNFQDGSIPGKIQFGPAWWFNDSKEGMIEQMKVLSSMGLLSRFVGMLTDSRSFLSFPRHEYFRRILCNEIGKQVENGEYPCDMEFLGKMVEDICYYNVERYANAI